MNIKTMKKLILLSILIPTMCWGQENNNQSNSLYSLYTTQIQSTYPSVIKTDTYNYSGIIIGSEAEHNSGYIYRTTPYGESETAIRQRSAGSIQTYEFDGTVNSEYGSREPNSMSTHSDGSFSIYDSYGSSRKYLNGTLISTIKYKPKN